MYLELFKLRELPFRLSPDPQFLYLSKQHARAKAFMESTVWLTDGFVIITGEIGAGKTTLIESFLQELSRDVVLAQISQTQVTVVDFLQSVLVQFGFSPFKMKKAELIATLNNFLAEQYAAGRKVLLIVDEAQNLSMKVLEEVRMLSGVETTKDKVLRIILAGQPELSDKLDAPELVQLSQRVRLRFHLGTLPEAETRAYIQHRLDVAGADGREIFAEDTFAEIFRYTGGVPRLINNLCDTAMLAAFGADRDHITLEDIRASIGELGWVEFSARPQQVPRHHGSLQSQRMPLLGSHATAAPHAAHEHGNTTELDPAVVARLLIATDGHPVREMLLRPGRILIGRTPENDLQIDSRFVSRHHCQITVTAQGSTVEDLNSTNGMQILGKRVRRHNLNDGDVVIIGTHELMYVDERMARARGSAHPHPAAGAFPAGTGEHSAGAVRLTTLDPAHVDDPDKTHFQAGSPT